MDTRDISFNILKRIEEEDAYVSDVLGQALTQLQFKEKRDRAFITRLVEGVTERRLSLDFLIDKFSSKTASRGGQKKRSRIRPDVRILLRMGIYQIRYMESVPNRAAISETVRLVKEKGYEGLSGYVNALLRRIEQLYDEKKLDSYLVSDNSVRYSTPKWLVDFLTECYGKEMTKQILEDQFAEHPTVVRVNLARTSMEELKKSFEDKGITVLDGSICSDRCLRISGYDQIKRLPGYRDGLFTVQDETSVSAIEKLQIKPGDTVLDLCASPGGKSTLAYEMSSDDEETGLIISCDISDRKLELIEENAERLQIPNGRGEIPAGIKTAINDATILNKDFIDVADVVIADVPCSGLGIIGRKNDIKYHASLEAMSFLAKQGLTILKNASRYVKKEGRICFSTCTINPGENQEVVQAFLDSEEGAGFKILEERTFLQGVDGSDGFYYCILNRI